MIYEEWNCPMIESSSVESLQYLDKQEKINKFNYFNCFQKVKSGTPPEAVTSAMSTIIMPT